MEDPTDCELTEEGSRAAEAMSLPGEALPKEDEEARRVVAQVVHFAVVFILWTARMAIENELAIPNHMRNGIPQEPWRSCCWPFSQAASSMAHWFGTVGGQTCSIAGIVLSVQWCRSLGASTEPNLSTVPFSDSWSCLLLLEIISASLCFRTSSPSGLLCSQSWTRKPSKLPDCSLKRCSQ